MLDTSYSRHKTSTYEFSRKELLFAEIFDLLALSHNRVAVGAALLMYVARKINIHMLENVLFGSILLGRSGRKWSNR